MKIGMSSVGMNPFEYMEQLEYLDRSLTQTQEVREACFVEVEEARFDEMGGEEEKGEDETKSVVRLLSRCLRFYS